MTRHYVEQVWSYVTILQKHLTYVMFHPPIEDLAMEENDYITI
jgi:hypothetical protein